MSRGAGTQYSIGSPTRMCAATGRELLTGEKYVAVLCQQREGDEYARLDYCEQAWKDGARPGRELITLGYWRGVMGAPGAKRNIMVDDESLLEMFEQSGEGEDSETAERLAFRFVLGLILMRKRLLVHESSRDRGRVLLVRAKGTEKPPAGPPLLELVDPGMTAELVAKVTEQLQAVLTDTAAAIPGPAAGAGAAGSQGGAA